LASIDLEFADGATQNLVWLNPCAGASSVQGLTVCRLSWTGLKQVSSIKITAMDGLSLHGAALIDQASGAFQSFVIAPNGEFNLVHSGDVKVYENVNVQSRAFFVSNEQTVTSDEDAITLMKSAQFDPSQSVVLIGSQESNSTDHLVIPSSSHLVTYDPEHIVVDVNAPQDGYLVITDAYYPGWVATVGDRAAEIDRADVLFRAVKVPQGQHRIELRYDPLSFKIGSIVSLGAWMILIALLVITRKRVIISNRLTLNDR
jgi:hypothetical protein